MLVGLIMNLHLNKGTIMKNVLLIILLLLSSMQAADNLHALDTESQKFLKAIVGLENDYLEKKMNKMEKRGNGQNAQYKKREKGYKEKEEKKISKEEFEKKIFKQEASIARLTSDFSRIKNLLNLKIKSMYSFNNKSYVVLQKKDANKNTTSNEQSFDIEGRYIVGDYIFSHEIIQINTRNKNIKLFKKVDKNYYYVIYLSNYDISVSPLLTYKKKASKRKTPKKKASKRKTHSTIKQHTNKKTIVTKKAPQKRTTKELFKNTISTNTAQSCRYKIKATMVNVREKRSLNSRIVKLLKKNDLFSISEKLGSWYHLHTIYRHNGDKEKNVQKEDIWVKLGKNSSLIFQNKCF